jgi:fucose 4-O-acetylase-like acetyltransferase
VFFQVLPQEWLGSPSTVVGMPEVLIASALRRLSCRKAAKARTLSLLGHSSGNPVFVSAVLASGSSVTRSVSTARSASPAPVLEPIVRPVRVIWVDTAKGFGIILVVYEHVIRGLASSDLMTWTATTRFIDSWIYTFHMPLFFFLSGLFLVRSVQRRWGTFALGKLRTIAYPYFAWSVITVILKAALGGIPNLPSDLSDLLLILYRPVAQYWFLYVLFILSLAISALLKLGVRPWAVLVLAILVYPGVLPISYWWGVVSSEVREFAIYVTLGVVIGWDRDLRAISCTPIGWLAAVVVTGLMVSSLGGFVELQEWRALEPSLAVSGTVTIVALSVLADKAKLDAAIRFLGRYSLEIYVVHSIASAAARIALQKVAHVSAAAPHILLGTLAGLYMPIVLVLIFHRIGFRFGFTLPSPIFPHPSIRYPDLTQPEDQYSARPPTAPESNFP